MKNSFGRFSSLVNALLASPAATVAAFLVVFMWAALGPVTHYSSNWQLVINTGTSIITFLMVFILNNAQNRDTAAMNAKLDALIAAIERADNRFIGLEKQSVSDAEAICEAVIVSAEAQGISGG